MRVLTEFTRDLSDTHLPNVGPVILQEMFRIIQSDTVRILHIQVYQSWKWLIFKPIFIDDKIYFF